MNTVADSSSFYSSHGQSATRLFSDFFWDSIHATFHLLPLTWTTAAFSYLHPLLGGLFLLSLDSRRHHDHVTFMLVTPQLPFLGCSSDFFKNMPYKILHSAAPSWLCTVFQPYEISFISSTEPRSLNSKPLHTVSLLPQTFLCPFTFVCKQHFPQDTFPDAPNESKSVCYSVL